MSFEPNWASPPGDTVARLMASGGFTESELADQIGLGDSLVSDLLKGQIEITNDLAEVLSRALGASPQFWMRRQDQYIADRQRLERISSQVDLEEWGKSFPARSLKDLGWLTENVRGRALADAMLGFFGCDSLNEWRIRYSTGIGQVAFRTSFAFAADENSTLAWLRTGELCHAKLPLSKYSPQRFSELLPKLKKLSVLKHPKIFLPRLQKACAEVGVGVVTARAPVGCRASGASWVSESKAPVIFLSFRHLSEDHFWFTFFHEAAHVVLHGESHIDFECSDPSPLGNNNSESEANAFAQQILIPDDLREKILVTTPTRVGVRSFARLCDITPGIVVGQLQKEKILRQNQFSDLKRRYKWGNNPLIPELYQPRK